MSMRTVAAVALLLATIGFAAVDIAAVPFNLGYADYVLVWVVFALVGAVLAIRRPANPIGWLFLVMGVLSDGEFVAHSGGAVDPAGGLASVLRLVLAAWSSQFGLLPVLLILFPTGRPPTRRWWIPIGGAALIMLIGVLTRTLDVFSARLRDEIDLEALERELVGLVNDTTQPAHATVWLRGAKS